MKFLSLFSGIGGFDLGLERAGMECVGQVENNDYCNKILEKHWPGIKRVKDIRNVHFFSFNRTVELICGGFPCQPFSVAGQRKGKKDDRWLWPEMLRVIKIYKPNWVIGENVAGIINLALKQLLSDLEGQGYECLPFIIPACAVDAPHRRDRVWIIANRTDTGIKGLCKWKKSILADAGRRSARPKGYRLGCEQINSKKKVKWPEARDGFRNSSKNISDSEKQGLEGPNTAGNECADGWSLQQIGMHGWPTESGIRRVAHGIPNRMDRIKALGNAVVPQIPEIIGRAIMSIENENKILL